MSSTEIVEPEAPEVSNEIEEARPADPSQSVHKEEDKTEEKPDDKPKPESRMDAIKRAAKDLEEDEAAKDEKTEDKEPAKTKEDDKAAAKEEDDSDKDADEKPVKAAKDDDGRHANPPAKFMPDAKEKWMNAPRAVRRDVENAFNEYERQLSEAKQSNERYEAIRDFDELAQQNGRDLRDSLIRVNEIENQLQQNPVAGLNRILMEAGPRKPDGQPYSLFEVATAIVQQGQQGYQQMVARQPQQQQQPQEDPRVTQLEQQLAQMQQQQLAASVIEPFKAANPRYAELQDDIAFFLKSGRIDKSLDPSERLAVAYDMAVRMNPAPQSAQQGSDDGLALDSRVAKDLNGQKSIKGAPTSGTDTTARRKGRMSHKEAIDAAFAEHGL